MGARGSHSINPLIKLTSDQSSAQHCCLFQLLGQILYTPQYGVLLLGVALKPLVGVVSSLAHFKFLCNHSSLGYICTVMCLKGLFLHLGPFSKSCCHH